MRRSFGIQGTLFLLAAVLSAGPASAQLPAAIRVVSGNSTLKFVYDTELGVVPYTLKTGTITFTFVPESIWRVELWGRSPATCPTSSSPCLGVPALPCFSVDTEELDASDATGFQSTGTDQGRTFQWTGIDGPGSSLWNVAVDVQADGSGGFRWSSHITLAVPDSSEPRGVGRLDLPQLRFADPGATSQLLVGSGGGLQIVDPAHNAYALEEPGLAHIPIKYKHPVRGLPLLGITNASGTAVVGLSLNEKGTARWRHKEIVAHGDGTDDVFLTIGRFPDDPFTPPTATIDVGESILKLIPTRHSSSAWFDLAAWYRAEREGPEEPLFPKRVKMADITNELDHAALDYDLLVIEGVPDPKSPPAPEDMGLEYAGFIQDAVRIVNDVGTTPDRVVLIWFDWHKNIIGEELPSTMPPDDQNDFLTAIQTAQGMGFHVVPYASTSVFNDDHEDFCDVDVQAELWAWRNPDGTPVIELGTGAGGVPLGAHRYVLDRSLPEVDDYYMEFTFTPLFDPIPAGDPATTFGLDGVYLDAFPAIGPCYAAAGDGLHTHPVGGADDIAVGVATFVNGLELELEQYGKPAYLFNETASEVLVDELAGSGQYYWVNEPNVVQNTLGYVPLFAAVYHAYVPFAVNRFQDVMTCVTDMEHCVPPGAAFCSDAALAMFHGVCPAPDLSVIDIYVTDTAMHMFWLWATGHRLTWTHRDALPGQLLGDGTPMPDSLLGFDGFQGKFEPLIEMFENCFTLSALLGNRDGLFEGEMAVPPQLTFNPADLQDHLHEGSVVPFQQTKVPPVYSFAFIESDKDVVVTFANWTDESITFGLHIDPTWYGITTLSQWKVIQSTVEDGDMEVQNPLTPPSTWLNDPAKVLAPRSQEVVRFEKR